MTKSKIIQFHVKWKDREGIYTSMPRRSLREAKRLARDAKSVGCKSVRIFRREVVTLHYDTYLN